MEYNINTAMEYEQLGEDYYLGRDRERNLDKARSCFYHVLKYGEGEVRWEALCNLALLTEDLHAKLALYTTAAAEGCAHAMNMAGICSEQLGEDWAALSWYREAARAGSVSGMYNCALRTTVREEKLRMLTRAWEEYGHEPSRELLKKAHRELEAWKQDQKVAEFRRRKRTEPYREEILRKARGQEEQPAVIVRRLDLPPGEWNGLVWDVARELAKPVILLAGRAVNDVLPCVGYDPFRAGLREAMENRYREGECWSMGRFTIGGVCWDNLENYRREVLRILWERG